MFMLEFELGGLEVQPNLDTSVPGILIASNSLRTSSERD